MAVHILGAGSIGSLVAWHLSKASVPVTLLLRAPSLSELSHGRSIRLEYQSLSSSSLTREGQEFHVAVESCGASHGASSSSESPIRNLIIATKASDTAIAIAQISRRIDRKAEVLMLQNGSLAVYSEITRLLPSSCHISMGICTHGAYKVAPGHVLQSSVGNIKIFGPCDLSLECLSDEGHKSYDPPDDGKRSLIENLTSVPTLQAERMDHGSFMKLVWLKLAINCSANPTAALIGCRNEGLTSQWGKKVVGEVSVELFDVLGRGRLGLDSAGSLEDKIVDVLSGTGKNLNSMLQDIRAGRKTEIEYLNGYVMRQAESRGVKTPVNNLLYLLIKARESATQVDFD
jgi:2-dehydropantoate 2-reductase